MLSDVDYHSRVLERPLGADLGAAAKRTDLYGSEKSAFDWATRVGLVQLSRSDTVVLSLAHPIDTTLNLSTRQMIRDDLLQGTVGSSTIRCATLLDEFLRQWNEARPDDRLESEELRVFMHGHDVTDQLYTAVVPPEMVSEPHMQVRFKNPPSQAIISCGGVPQDNLPKKLVITVEKGEHAWANVEQREQPHMAVRHDVEKQAFDKPVNTLLEVFASLYKVEHPDEDLDMSTLALYSGDCDVTNMTFLDLYTRDFNANPTLLVKHKIRIIMISNDPALLQYGHSYPFHLAEPHRKFNYGFEGVQPGRVARERDSSGGFWGAENHVEIEYHFAHTERVPEEAMAQARRNTNGLLKYLANAKTPQGSLLGCCSAR